MKKRAIIIKNRKAHIFIICEIAQAHSGSFSVAKKLIKSASIAGADAIKFQIVYPDELLVTNHDSYGLFSKTAFTDAQWRELFHLSRSVGLKIFADVFGKKSLALLSKNNIDGFKIHSTEIKNSSLIKQIAAQKKLILLSTSGSTLKEIQKALSILRQGKNEVVLLHGFQGYPTSVEDTNLRKIIALQKKFHMPTGFADHISGGSAYKNDICLMALAIGCSVLEKHMTLDRKKKGYDYYSSLNPDEFNQFVERVRAMESALGSVSLSMTAPEKIYRISSKKHVVASRDLCSGHIIAEDDIVMKRTKEKYPFQEPESIIGKKSLIPIIKDSVIKSRNITR
ncbi:MAG: hypothetical protein COW93_01105 [Parcubacteria group bacterium CG22_combo_CG10-13_8_21_14_all_41_9]|nr:MAG: hypothetical protein COW93_01105 [Parcubacteria group bacterium CG22_combo_CG10-13_8_21_14_all_41_9]